MGEGTAQAKTVGQDTIEDKLNQKIRGEGLKREKSQRRGIHTHAKKEKKEGEVDDLIARKIAAKSSGKTLSRRRSQKGFDKAPAEKGRRLQCLFVLNEQRITF